MDRALPFTFIVLVASIIKHLDFRASPGPELYSAGTQSLQQVKNTNRYLKVFIKICLWAWRYSSVVECQLCMGKSRIVTSSARIEEIDSQVHTHTHWVGGLGGWGLPDFDSPALRH